MNPRDDRGYVVIYPFHGSGFEYGSPSIRRGRGILTFSDVEKKQLLISVAVLTLAFTIADSGGIGGLFILQPIVLAVIFIASFLSSATAFLLHELGHKYVAMSHNLWSEYRYYPFGLMFALLLSMFGVLFAAPGAVMIYGYPSKDENGRISIAGPVVNTTVAIVFFALGLWIASVVTSQSFIVGAAVFICFRAAYINIFLAGFNMIPIPPLDGSKVIKWNIGYFIIIWIIILAVGISIYGITMPFRF